MSEFELTYKVNEYWGRIVDRKLEIFRELSEIQLIDKDDDLDVQYKWMGFPEFIWDVHRDADYRVGRTFTAWMFTLIDFDGYKMFAWRFTPDEVNRIDPSPYVLLSRDEYFEDDFSEEDRALVEKYIKEGEGVIDLTTEENTT